MLVGKGGRCCSRKTQHSAVLGGRIRTKKGVSSRVRRRASCKGPRGNAQAARVQGGRALELGVREPLQYLSVLPCASVSFEVSGAVPHKLFVELREKTASSFDNIRHMATEEGSNGWGS